LQLGPASRVKFSNSIVNRTQQVLREYLTAVFTWHPGRLAKGSLAISAGMALRALTQTCVFLIVARALGVESYGAYAAVLAIAGTLSSFVGVGTQILIMRDSACDPKRFPEAWGLGLAAIGLSAQLLLGIYLLTAWAILPSGIPWVSIMLIGFAEIMCSPLLEACINAFQGHERIGQAVQILLVPVIFRLIGSLILMVLSTILPIGMRLVAWGYLYAITALLAVAYSILLVQHDFGLSLKPSTKGLLSYLREGVAFAFGSAAQKLYVDIDKTMIARLSTLEAAGVYSAGYRVVDIVIIPLCSILTAGIPRLFRVGESGTGFAVRYALRLLPFPLVYALSSALIMQCMAEYIPLVLGQSYAPAVDVLKYLALLPVVMTPRLFLQVGLSTSGHQGVVVGLLTAGALINILLNLWLIPKNGWQGAVAATYAAEICIILLIIGLLTMRRTEASRDCHSWRPKRER
jgi:O-antigen/teichoic acid export membrane protein